MPTRFFQFRKAIVGYCMLIFAVFVVISIGLHNYFSGFRAVPMVAKSCHRKTRNGCTAIGTAVNKLSWKAGALTIVLHLRMPSMEIVSLDILTYLYRNVNPFFCIFLRHTGIFSGKHETAGHRQPLPFSQSCLSAAPGATGHTTPANTRVPEPPPFRPAPIGWAAVGRRDAPPPDGESC